MNVIDTDGFNDHIENDANKRVAAAMAQNGEYAWKSSRKETGWQWVVIDIISKLTILMTHSMALPALGYQFLLHLCWAKSKLTANNIHTHLILVMHAADSSKPHSMSKSSMSKCCLYESYIRPSQQNWFNYFDEERSNCSKSAAS